MTEIGNNSLKSVIGAPVRRGVWNLTLPNLSMLDWYALLLPLASWVSVNVGGTLFGSDFMIIFGFPLVATTSLRVLFYKPVRRVLILGGLWLLSQIVTDIIRDTPVVDLARGWLKIIFTLAQFTVVWTLIYNSKRRCFLYAVGLASGDILRSVTYRDAFFAADPWKFGYAFPLSVLLLLLVSHFMRKSYSVYYLLPLLLLAIVNIFEGFRSQSFILAITMVVTHGYKSLRASGRTLSRKRLVLIAVVVLVAIATLNILYSYAASHMWLGENSYKKYKEQAQGVGGVLLGGRSEILGSSAAVADSPWIGHGSWAKDPKYLWIMLKRERELGYRGGQIDQGEQEAAQIGSIPAHSHLMGAWVEAGLLGAVFWFYILFLIVRFLFTLTGDEPFLPLAMFQVTVLFWDILFSPYAAERRFSFTYFLALLLAITYQRERQQAWVKRKAAFDSTPVFAGSL